MKTISIVLLLSFLFWNFNTAAQTNTDTRKFIEVTGSAEMYVQPDEIELEVTLVEYTKYGQDMRMKNIEADFYTILNRNNINKDAVILDNTNSYTWWYWWNEREKPYKSKTLKLKLSGETNFLKFADDLNQKWVQSMQVVDRKNKDLQKYRKDVKIQAIKAAKEKATYLLESVGENIGTVISIEEVNESNNYWNTPRNLLSNSNVMNVGNTGDDDVKNAGNIKLRYEIKAKFEIK